MPAAVRLRLTPLEGEALWRFLIGMESLDWDEQQTAFGDDKHVFAGRRVLNKLRDEIRKVQS